MRATPHILSLSSSRLAVVLAALTAVGLAGCKPASGPGEGGSTSAGSAGNTIKVGHYASMTGATATFGTETDDGIKLAVKQLNAKGGVLGKTFVVETQDDQSKPDEAKTVATHFAEDPEIVAALGEVASTRSMIAAPVFQKAGIPMISPSSTNPAVTTKGNYIFRVCFIDPFQGYVMAKFAHDDLKVGTVAIMRDPSSDYSVGLADVFTKEFVKMGGKISADASYKADDSDFRSQLTQIKAGNPQAIFIPGYYGEVGTIARQARELGIMVPLLGCDGWDSEKLVEGAGGPGKALEGCYFSNHYSKDDKSPRVQQFVKEYTAEYGSAPSGLAALGYDAMNILADAITKAGSTDRSKVRDALAAEKDFPGVTGDITMDANRNVTKPAVVLQIKGSEFVYKTTVKPEGAPATAAAGAAAAPQAASAK